MNLLEQRQGDFYDLWETTSQERRQEFIRERIKEIIDIAMTKTPYYKGRFDAYKVDLTDEFPLKECPVLTSSQLRELLPPLGQGLMSRKTQDYNVFQSGGTTGLPKTALFSHAELEALNLPNARGFYACGLSEKDRVANLFAVGGLYMTFVHINRMLQQFGCMNFPFSNQTPPEFVGRVAEHFKVNCFTGIASSLLHCLRSLHDASIPLELDKFFYGGEHIYDADRLELKEKFGIESILAPGYGTVDSWYVGYQCRYSPPGVFHAHDDQCYLEIVDEDHPEKRACRPLEVGHLYATVFERTLTPIIRYRLGDKGFWLKDPCPCGRTTPQFKLLGRGDDVLRIGYDFVDYSLVQKLVSHIKGLSGTVQMEKRREEGKDGLIIRVETARREEEYEELRKKLLSALLSEKPSLHDFVKKEMILTPQIEFFPPLALPLNPRTGKLIRVIDCI